MAAESVEKLFVTEWTTGRARSASCSACSLSERPKAVAEFLGRGKTAREMGAEGFECGRESGIEAGIMCATQRIMAGCARCTGRKRAASDEMEEKTMENRYRNGTRVAVDDGEVGH